MHSRTINTIGIVGTGLIGGAWAASFLNAGLNVFAWDPAAGAEARLSEIVDGALSDLNLLDPTMGIGSGTLTFRADLESAVTGSDFIQENGPENLEIKKTLLAKIDRIAGPDVIIASSTSSLRATDIQGLCKYPERILVAHPFNPPHLIPLVELVRGEKTSLDTQESAAAFFQSIGKVPICVKKEAVGHVANRMTAALWREAVHIVTEGIATVEDVDRAIRFGPGLRWAIDGPHMLYHLGGGSSGIRGYLENLGPAQEARWAELGNPRLTESTKLALIEGIEIEAAGRTMDELASRRDRLLIKLLQTLAADDSDGT